MMNTPTMSNSNPTSSNPANPSPLNPNSKVHTRSARETIVNPSGLAQLEVLRTTSHLLKDALARDNAEISAIQQELTLMEQSILHIHRKGDHFFFGASTDSSESPSPPRPRAPEVGITEDIARVQRLARRAYLKQRLSILEKNAHRLRKILKSSDASFYEGSLLAKLGRYVDAGIDLCQVLFTPEQNEWINQPYSPNPFYQSSLKYTTEHGIPVRSKSESIFGSFLESIGLPYRSDDLVTIHSDLGEQPFRDSYFADFKIPNLCGGITIHEHLGALHLDDYPDNSLKRLNDYQNYTVFEIPGRPVTHREFTWSFEHDLLNRSLREELLRRILLP